MPTNSLTTAVVPALELANSNREWMTLSELHDYLDNHFFNYVEMHLPFYKEMKRREADVS